MKGSSIKIKDQSPLEGIQRKAPMNRRSSAESHQDAQGGSTHPLRMWGQAEGAALAHPGEETTWDIPKSSSRCPQVHQRDEALHSWVPGGRMRDNNYKMKKKEREIQSGYEQEDRVESSLGPFQHELSMILWAVHCPRHGCDFNFHFELPRSFWTGSHGVKYVT